MIGKQEYHLVGFPTPKIKVRLRKYLPFVVHFLLTASVASLMLFYVHDGKFNLTSREPALVESDGSISRHSHYVPLQSDITTLVSFAASVTRVAGGWWAGSLVWRCILLFLEKGRISLKGLKQVTRPIPFPLDGLRSKSDRTTLLLVLIATFSLDYFGSVITGSVTWSQAFDYTNGNVPITGVNRSTVGISLESYRQYSEVVLQTITYGTVMDNRAWGTSFDDVGNSTNAPLLKRVLDSARYLSVNSTVHNLTLPYFSVDSFEWIKNPDATLTSQQMFLMSDQQTYYQYSPYFAEWGKVGLIPDNKWGPLSNLLTPDPHIVSEARILSYRIARLWGSDRCEQVDTTDFGSQIQPFTVTRSNDTGVDCFAMANVTYTAGAAVCHDCRLASPQVFQSDGTLTVIPDSLTSEALALAPVLGTYMIFGVQSVPQNPANPQNFAIELISRSYQAAWASLTDGRAPGTEQTETRISVLMTQADVIAWRVYLWVALHICILVGGLLFVYLHSRYDHPWVNDPVLAAFLLNNGDVMDKEKWKQIDAWEAKGDDMPEGLVHLREGNGNGRYLKLEP